ncbi:MAG: hypothetical protein ACFFKA_19330 [Candidatus Thorarchaeota archaeon]
MINFSFHDPILTKIIKSILDKHQNNIISVYGLGSFFNSSKKYNWVSSDIDIIILVKLLDLVPKRDWTNVRYEKLNIDGYTIWMGFNSLEGLLNKEKFKQESFANYEWSIYDLKYKENSQLLYGKDIRNTLPDISDLKIDYDDIFTRSLYHLNKSFGIFKNNEELHQAKLEFTKALFKFGFYICIFYDNRFHFTSIYKISQKLTKIKNRNSNIQLLQNLFQEAIDYRINHNFVSDFKSLRTKFTFLILSLIKTGSLHRLLNFEEFLSYLEQKFNGLYNIINFLKRAKNLYYASEDHKL